MSNKTNISHVRHRRHSNSSFERRKQRDLEQLSISPRAQIPAFLVGQQTASLFKPLEYELAQIDNRVANINRSPSRTGSLTSSIYGDLPLSAICGSSPTSPLYDKHGPLTSQLGESMETSSQMKASSRKIAKSLSKIEPTLKIMPGGIQDISAFSDTSSDYSPWPDSNRDSWLLNPRGLNLQPQLSPTSHPSTTAKVEIINESITAKTPVAPNNSILSPFNTRPIHPAPFADGYSAPLTNLRKDTPNKNTDSHPDITARTFSDQGTKGLKDILNATEEDHTRWLAVNKLSSPLSIKQHDEILHSHRKDHLSLSSNTGSKLHQPLTIRTKSATKHSRITWSPSIPRRASALLEEARQSFKCGVDELSSPATSRSGQSFLLSSSPYTSPASEYSTNLSTPNTGLIPFPDFHSTTQSHFFPSSPIPEENSHSEHADKVSELKSTKRESGKYIRKKFGWDAKHPLKSPHPHPPEKGFPKDALSTIVNTAMRIGSLASSHNAKERRTSTSIIMNHKRSDRGPDTPFPTSSRHDTGARLSSVTSPAYEDLPASPAGSPLSGIVGSFRNAIGVKTKEERQKVELERLMEEREARRKDILEERGIRLMGEVVHGPEISRDAVTALNYAIPTSSPIPPASPGEGGKCPGSESEGRCDERATKASRIFGVSPVSATRDYKVKPERANLHAPTFPDTRSGRQVLKAPPGAPTSIPLPASLPTRQRALKASISLPTSPAAPLAELPLLPRSAVSPDGTTWL